MMKKNEANIQIGQVIRESMHRQNHGPKWLSEQIHCSRVNVYNIYKSKSINTEMLYKISNVLGEDFFVLYSESLQRGIKSRSMGNCLTDI